jgi:ArsR family metal-binding transcriptional regulator
MATTPAGDQQDRLIRNWDLELVTPPCLPGAERWTARARLDEDISEVLPYLNAALPGAKLQPTGDILTWRGPAHHHAFRPHEICSAPVIDNEEARRVTADIVQVVNDIWRRRAEIEPDFSRREPPGVLAIYKLLPGTNCGECGHPTCMAYANALREGAAKASGCLPLCRPGQEEGQQRLLELLGEGL